MEQLKVMGVLRKGQTLDHILVEEPRGFVDRVGSIRERVKARITPPFLAQALGRVVSQFNFYIYDSWIISSYHLYLHGLDKYHQLNQQALSGNKQDPPGCDLLCQALAFGKTDQADTNEPLLFHRLSLSLCNIICKGIIQPNTKCLDKGQ